MPRTRAFAFAVLVGALTQAGAREPSGSLVVAATVRAYIPAELKLAQARAVVVGPLPGGDVHSGEAASTPCLPVEDLPPGRYRLLALEGRVSTVTARPRFLYPDPDEGYRVPGERRLDGFQLYRVLVPKDPAFEVEVQPGDRALLGHIDVVRKPRSVWGVAVRRTATPDPAQTCQASGNSAASSGATSTMRSAPERGT